MAKNHDEDDEMLKNIFADFATEAAELAEILRVKRIAELGLVGKILDETYDDAIALASQICGVTMAAITIIDDKHQYIKNGIGAKFPTSTPREEGACNITIQHPNEVIVISDTKLDPRVNTIPAVVDLVRFYIGAPLVTLDGFAVGSLCAYATEPRSVTEEQQASMKRLARIVSRMLERLR